MLCAERTMISPTPPPAPWRCNWMAWDPETCAKPTVLTPFGVRSGKQGTGKENGLEASNHFGSICADQSRNSSPLAFKRVTNQGLWYDPNRKHHIFILEYSHLLCLETPHTTSFLLMDSFSPAGCRPQEHRLLFSRIRPSSLLLSIRSGPTRTYLHPVPLRCVSWALELFCVFLSRPFLWFISWSDFGFDVSFKIYNAYYCLFFCTHTHTHRDSNLHSH